MRRTALGAVAALLLFAAPAHAATFNVNVQTDDAVCNAITCSLRGAILAAQANGSAAHDEIDVPAGIYATPEVTLTGANATNITIVGGGANSTFWQPAGATRVLTLGTGANIALQAITVRNGRPASGFGGNISVTSARLALDGVRITNGQAAGGGGIYVDGSTATTALNVTRSLIDTNVAIGTSDGGGVYATSETFPFAPAFTDTTIAFNTAARGGGVFMTNNSAPTLRGVTVAYNRATSGGTGGLGGFQSANTGATIQGSLFVGNTTRFNTGSAPVDVPAANCSFSPTPTDQGGNIDDGTTCALAGTASRQNVANVALGTALDGSQPPALALPATSPAVDFSPCAGRTSDERGVPRPQGTQCDAGAYEYDPPPDTTISGGAPPYSFTATDAGSTFECAIDGGAFTACTSPYTPTAAPGTHTLAVRAVDPELNPDLSPATVTFTVAVAPTPTATPSPTPVANRIVVGQKTKGTVKIKLKGTKTFVTLGATAPIPVGSEVDTRNGEIVLTSIPKAGAAPQSARFFDGLFTVTQSKGITNLTLSQALAACPKAGHASAAAKKPKTRRLWGSGKGNFRTTGKYSAATSAGPSGWSRTAAPGR